MGRSSPPPNGSRLGSGRQRTTVAPTGRPRRVPPPDPTAAGRGRTPPPRRQLQRARARASSFRFGIGATLAVPDIEALAAANRTATRQRETNHCAEDLPSRVGAKLASRSGDGFVENHEPTVPT